MGKRRLILSTLVSVVAAVLLLPGTAVAEDTSPVPIPGGIQIPGGPLIHVFAPGPEDLGFQGLDVEPSTITDFTGSSAIAYPAGTATDADGNTYTMFNDMRVFVGTYRAADGVVRHGTFVFI
jgi:hypothetical protein